MCSVLFCRCYSLLLLLLLRLLFLLLLLLLLLLWVCVGQALERHMSYRDILVLRREARGWRLEDMGDEPPEDPPLDPDLMAGIAEGDPQVRHPRVEGGRLGSEGESIVVPVVVLDLGCVSCGCRLRGFWS